MKMSARFLCLMSLVTALALSMPFAILGQASSFTSIVVFGDSLSDTGNNAAVSGAKYGAAAQVPAPATGYTFGRFTDGTDTLPAAKLYTGVWVEQLAAMLPAKPTVINSLAGGQNYAYGFATTNTGTTNFTYGPGNALSFPVSNMGKQVSDYLATSPTINNQVLFVVWGGANDLINATSSADIVAAATRETVLIQTLINAGASNFIVPFLPPLGLVPRYNSSATVAAQINLAAAAYNQALSAGLAQLAAANVGKSLAIYPLDTATLFNTIAAAPANYGFTNVTASSQGKVTVNPDTYLFWDDLHPTTTAHRLIALSAMRLLSSAVATNTALAVSSTTINLNSSVTLTATVINGAGGTDTPLGSVTFLDGTTSIGTATVVGTSGTGTATLTTASLGAGTHSLRALFTGVNGFGGSASGTVTETVIPPTFAVSLFPTSQTIHRGETASTIVSITPSGGYMGSFTVSCGTLPAHVSCSVQAPNLTINSSNTVSTAVVLATNVAANEVPSFFARKNSAVLAGFGLPIFGGLAFAMRRRYRISLRLMALLMVSSLTLLGLTACGSSNSNTVAPGSYSVPIVVTPASGSAVTQTFTISAS